jgi:hypothetical protein
MDGGKPPLHLCKHYANTRPDTWDIIKYLADLAEQLVSAEQLARDVFRKKYAGLDCIKKLNGNLVLLAPRMRDCGITGDRHWWPFERREQSTGRIEYRMPAVIAERVGHIDPRPLSDEADEASDRAIREYRELLGLPEPEHEHSSGGAPTGAQTASRSELDAWIGEVTSESLRLKEGKTPEPVQENRYPRDPRFQKLIPALYGYCCAVCGSGMQTADGRGYEVQAAHLYPKRLDGRDAPANGICLCRLHHWAIDSGWMYFTDAYIIRVRDDIPADGYEEIVCWDGNCLQLPEREDARPHPKYLQEHRKLWGFD